MLTCPDVQYELAEKTQAIACGELVSRNSWFGNWGSRRASIEAVRSSSFACRILKPIMCSKLLSTCSLEAPVWNILSCDETTKRILMLWELSGFLIPQRPAIFVDGSVKLKFSN